MFENFKLNDDPVFKDLGFHSWQYFSDEFKCIKSDYALYGEIVLEKRLGKSFDVYKEAFLSDNFKAEIRKIWEQRYHCVANTLYELISLYETVLENQYELDRLIPEKEYTERGETNGKDVPFAITKELYDTIASLISDTFEDNGIYLLKGNKVYKIFKRKDRLDLVFSISAVDIIEVN